MTQRKNITWFVIIILSFTACGEKEETMKVTDFDGNTYDAVQIGNQVWMAENLRTTKLNNGVPIPELKESNSWHTSKKPAYSWYENDTSEATKVGALYNYYAIETEKLCPAGWHVPTVKEFKELLLELDPQSEFVRHEVSYTAGSMLKSDVDEFVHNETSNNKNQSGFSAIPAGCRSFGGIFTERGQMAIFGGADNSSSMSLRASSNSVFLREKAAKYIGVSVRCVRDN